MFTRPAVFVFVDTGIFSIASEGNPQQTSHNWGLLVQIIRKLSGGAQGLTQHVKNLSVSCLSFSLCFGLSAARGHRSSQAAVISAWFPEARQSSPLLESLGEPLIS